MTPGRTIPLAWRNLTENKLRLLASVAGAAFAVTLMFMENGFRSAMLDSMVNVVERLDGRIVLVGRTLYTLAIPYTFPLRRLVQARNHPEVVGAVPVFVSTREGYWRGPETGKLERISVVGCPPEADVLDVPELKAGRQAWSRPDSATADALSRTDDFGVFREGQVSELSGRRIEIAGTFELGVNVQSNGNLVMSDRNMMKYFPMLDGPSVADRRVAVGVLRIRPGVDLERLRNSLQATLPPDVRVLTKDEFIARERDFWDKVAPIGTVFYIGVVMGFVVGSVICYQVLYADVSDRLGEFATLKAMGHTNLSLYRVVAAQAVYLALLGYVGGLAVSLVLFHWVHRATGLPLDLSRNNPFVVLALALVMCVGSGGFAARRLISADPAQLFA